MEDVTVSWPMSMTTERAKRYLLTAGFVPVELYREVKRKTIQPTTQIDVTKLATEIHEQCQYGASISDVIALLENQFDY